MKNRLVAILTLAFILISLQGTLAAQSNKVMVISEGELSPYWSPDKARPADYPAGALHHKQQGCASVSFFIEEDGTTSNHKVIVAAPLGVFDNAALRAARKLTYIKSEENHFDFDVFTSRTFTFTFKVVNDLQDGLGGKENLGELCLGAANERLALMGG
jgi:TonB family protein